jgi:hypothetical protein
MKIYDTFEEIEGLKPCKKRPVIVSAIQINEPFRVNSLEGDYKQGKAGDYLIKGIDGENYICDKAIFEKTYDWVKELPTDRLQKHIDRVNKYAAKLGKSFPDHDRDKKGTLLGSLGDPNGLAHKTDSAELDKLTRNHISKNPHHPEYWSNVDLTKFSRQNPTVCKVGEMSDDAIMEMCCDWCAMSEEFGNTPFEWLDTVLNKRWTFTPTTLDKIYKYLNILWNTKSESKIKQLIREARTTSPNPQISANLKAAMSAAGLNHTHIDNTVLQVGDKTYTYKLISATADLINKQDKPDKYFWQNKMTKMREIFNSRYARTSMEIINGIVQNNDTAVITIKFK